MSKRVHRVAGAAPAQVQPDGVQDAMAAPQTHGPAGTAPTTPTALELAQGPGWTLYRSRWEAALATAECDALITDPPYSARTHAAETTRNDGTDAAGLTPDYEPWSAREVTEFVAAWSPRVRGWMVCLCDDELIPAYRAAYRAVDRFDFAPVPCVIRGMSCRMQGDGPSSWVIYAMVARPRSVQFVGGWTRDGAYVVGSESAGRAGGSARGKGRGKPSKLEHALIRDYSLPGWTVCDPMAGFGGTLRAAVALGRKALGAEMDAEAFAEAKKRLARPLQVDLLAGLA